MLLDNYTTEQFCTMIGVDKVPEKVINEYLRVRYMYEAVGGSARLNPETLAIIASMAGQRNRQQFDYSDWGIGKLTVECDNRGIDTSGSAVKKRNRLIEFDRTAKRIALRERRDA